MRQALCCIFGNMSVHITQICYVIYYIIWHLFDACSKQLVGNLILNLCLLVLRFYGPVNPMGSCQAWSVCLTTLLLGRLSPLSGYNQYCAHSFARNWQLPFLNQQQGENDHRKYFMTNLYERLLPTWWGSNPQPPDHQSEDALLTEPQRPAWSVFISIFTLNIQTS